MTPAPHLYRRNGKRASAAPRHPSTGAEWEAFMCRGAALAKVCREDVGVHVDAAGMGNIVPPSLR